MARHEADQDYLRRVGANLTKARNDVHLSQEQVAEQLGISRPQTVGDWEKGESNFSIDALRRLCGIYKVSADWVLGLSENPNVRGAGAVIDLAVERSLLCAKTLPEAQAKAKQLGAMVGNVILVGFAIPDEYELLTDEQWEARRLAVRSKLEGLEHDRPSVFKRRK
jgi:transcriptional regulator with XRE-family HTH domain